MLESWSLEAAWELAPYRNADEARDASGENLEWVEGGWRDRRPEDIWVSDDSDRPIRVRLVSE